MTLRLLPFVDICCKSYVVIAIRVVFIVCVCGHKKGRNNSNKINKSRASRHFLQPFYVLPLIFSFRLSAFESLSGFVLLLLLLGRVL